MNIANAKIWSAALRSGSYKQITRYISDARGGFCCLGVAHLCLLQNRLLMLETRETYVDVRNALEISDDEMNQFVHMNDKQLQSFAEIAAFIDAKIAIEEARLASALEVA